MWKSRAPPRKVRGRTRPTSYRRRSTCAFANHLEEQQHRRGRAPAVSEPDATVRAARLDTVALPLFYPRAASPQRCSRRASSPHASSARNGPCGSLVRLHASLVHRLLLSRHLLPTTEHPGQWHGAARPRRAWRARRAHGAAERYRTVEPSARPSSEPDRGAEGRRSSRAAADITGGGCAAGWRAARPHGARV